MAESWIELSAILDRGVYNVVQGERYYGETEPRDAPRCRCESPGFVLDLTEHEFRCWKCGACPTDGAASRS
jgi:hypothetical protein